MSWHCLCDFGSLAPVPTFPENYAPTGTEDYFAVVCEDGREVKRVAKEVEAGEFSVTLYADYKRTVDAKWIFKLEAGTALSGGEGHFGVVVDQNGVGHCSIIPMRAPVRRNPPAALTDFRLVDKEVVFEQLSREFSLAGVCAIFAGGVTPEMVSDGSAMSVFDAVTNMQQDISDTAIEDLNDNNFVLESETLEEVRAAIAGASGFSQALSEIDKALSSGSQ